VDTQTPIATLLIVVVTALVSFRAFTDVRLREQLIFSPGAILADREYYRLITPALLHADGQHLLFNLLSLFLFGKELEPQIGRGHFLLIYLAAILGGNLLSLFLHRNHDYRALGASGGVCGVIFASVFLLPGGKIYMMPLPIGIPSWLYAILFLAAEFKGLKSARSNIGHDAHIGGAIIGLLVTTALFPDIVRWSPWLYAAVMGLSLAIFVYLWKNPLHLPLKSFFEPGAGRPVKPSPPKATTREVDAILEKISSSGLHSLTDKERQILQRAAKK
jgi:membrane associated rhomboid family serine protease